MQEISKFQHFYKFTSWQCTGKDFFPGTSLEMPNSNSKLRLINQTTQNVSLYFQDRLIVNLSFTHVTRSTFHCNFEAENCVVVSIFLAV